MSEYTDKIKELEDTKCTYCMGLGYVGSCDDQHTCESCKRTGIRIDRFEMWWSSDASRASLDFGIFVPTQKDIARVAFKAGEGND